jgi:putative flippase GtrA
MHIREGLRSEAFKYLLVGGLTALVYFGGIALATEVIHLHYHLGVSLAYVLAVSFHFLANRKYTFIAADGELRLQFARYLGVLLVNYLITISVVTFFVDGLGLSTYVGAMISIAVTVAIGYLASKFWVFHKRGI